MSSLRFVVGDRVTCLTEDEWSPGTVVALHYCRSDWDQLQTVPYQVELDMGVLWNVQQDTNEFCKGIEKAWWEPAFQANGHVPTDKNTFDWPGPYTVVGPTWVSSEIERGGSRVADAYPPQRLQVVEVRACGDRIRGRVAEPEGWISLRSTDDEKVWAVPQSSAYLRRFRSANPSLFNGECGDSSCDECSHTPGLYTDLGAAGKRRRSHMCVKKLRECFDLASEADPDQMDEQGCTALIASLKHHWLDAAMVLLEKGANVNLPDRQERWPLHYAVQVCVEAVPALLQARADPAVQDRNLGPGSGDAPLAQAPLHRTPLHYSAQSGQVAATIALLQARADPDARDADRKVPLHLAVEESHGEVVDILLENSAAIDLGNKEIGMNSSPLLDCVYRNDEAMVQKLVGARADLNLAGKNGMTALHLAVRARRGPLARLLITAGCDTSLKALGMTAADFAAKNGLALEVS